MDPVLVRNTVILFMAHYPEGLEAALCFPMGKLLSIGWSVIKNLMNTATAQRVQLLTEIDFRSHILEITEPESLTKRLGGFIPDDVANVSKVSLMHPKDDVNAEEIDEAVVADLVRELGDVDSTSK
ncbi:hypothetical protein HK098_000630 [Nowakowskiella sp. JEL0407]|nr:hypothetical protein HK098_000630 [Nowakowskiella sp. JEL0407]